MTKFAWAWVWLAFLMMLDIVVPWFVLTHVPRISGAFLFWTLWAAGAIASAFLVFQRWREVKP